MIEPQRGLECSGRRPQARCRTEKARLIVLTCDADHQAPSEGHGRAKPALLPKSSRRNAGGWSWPTTPRGRASYCAHHLKASPLNYYQVEKAEPLATRPVHAHLHPLPGRGADGPSRWGQGNDFAELRTLSALYLGGQTRSSSDLLWPGPRHHMFRDAITTDRGETGRTDSIRRGPASSSFRALLVSKEAGE